MQQQAIISGKTIAVTITDNALKNIKKREQALVVEMELYFSCLIRKAVRFVEGKPSAYSTEITENLILAFNPVMTEVCKVDPSGAAPPLTAFPIKKITPYVPKWVRIDFQGGEWCGEFGY
ncbi:MAG: hypothetical protein ACC707_02520 [Thiohalomonadales bacterium]